MVRIVKTEFYKLKRYHILWAGVALMLLSVLLTLFTSMANDGSVWDFAYLTEQVLAPGYSSHFGPGYFSQNPVALNQPTHQ